MRNITNWVTLALPFPIKYPSSRPWQIDDYDSRPKSSCQLGCLQGNYCSDYSIWLGVTHSLCAGRLYRPWNGNYHSSVQRWWHRSADHAAAGAGWMQVLLSLAGMALHSNDHFSALLLITFNDRMSEWFPAFFALRNGGFVYLVDSVD